MKENKNKKNNKIADNDFLIKRQAERIEELRQENYELMAKLEFYKSRERDIIDTLTMTRKKCEEYSTLIRVKYTIECDRIARFRAKLREYRNKETIVKAYDDDFANLKEWQEDMENALTKDLSGPLGDFFEEKKRLSDDMSDYSNLVENEKSNLEKVSQISEKELKELLEQL